MTILVTGGAGYIGSYVANELEQMGHAVVVLDNLSRGVREAVSGLFVHGDIRDAALLEKLFSTYRFEAVFHFAGVISVGDSFVETAAYYDNNVVGSLQLLQTMARYGVGYLVFSSSAAVYGLPQQERIRETDPLQPISPYGNTKLMIEMALKDYSRRYGIQYAALRYFNAAGADPEGKIVHYQRRECNLIPLILGGLLSTSFKFKLNGDSFSTPDGTCIRDYVHVEDLSRAHVLAFGYLKEKKKNLVVNLGNGEGYSNLEVMRCCEKVSGCKLNYEIGPARLGDAPKLVADAHLAGQELGWQPRYPRLEQMVEHAWEAMQKGMYVFN